MSLGNRDKEIRLLVVCHSEGSRTVRMAHQIVAGAYYYGVRIGSLAARMN